MARKTFCCLVAFVVMLIMGAIFVGIAITLWNLNFYFAPWGFMLLGGLTIYNAEEHIRHGNHR